MTTKTVPPWMELATITALNYLNIYTLHMVRKNDSPVEVEMSGITITPIEWTGTKEPKVRLVSYTYQPEPKVFNFETFLLLRRRGSELPLWDVGASGEKTLAPHLMHTVFETWYRLSDLTLRIAESLKADIEERNRKIYHLIGDDWSEMNWLEKEIPFLLRTRKKAYRFYHDSISHYIG